MDLKEARYILAIAHYKSIGKAAKALFISQPSLSKYLKNLEQQLGSPLFSRLEQGTLSILCRTDRSLWPGMGSGI